MTSALLEPLPFAGWEPTKTTLHLWCQIVGKIALRSTALRNHWWNCTLRPTARGVKTQLLQSGDTFFDIELDLAQHHAVVRASTASEPQTFSLHDGLSVAEFYTSLRAALRRFAIDVPIVAKPYGFPGQSTPFADDRENHAYDTAAVRRFSDAIAWTTTVFERFASDFAGKQGPVQLFWHGFDLALGRYSGRRADGPSKTDPVQREAYSHEVIAFGFWPGDANAPAPAYYTYTAPEPADLTTMTLAPAGAVWVPSGSGHMGILPYDAVRTADDPEAALLTFLRSGYDAGTRTARWDAAALAHTP
ncbi:MAG TPA: DUF5996 family protein [Candidatus Elarobacter sp.]|jgi:hypothetical protein